MRDARPREKRERMPRFLDYVPERSVVLFMLREK